LRSKPSILALQMTNIKRNPCLYDRCDLPRFSHGYCKTHQWARKDDKKPRAINKVSKKGALKKLEKAEYTLIQFAEFQKFYDQHPTKTCFECDTYIPVCRSYSVHHCLPKQTYKEIKLDPRFFILVCFLCHSKIETCIDFAPNTKAHTLHLKALIA